MGVSRAPILGRRYFSDQYEAEMRSLHVTRTQHQPRPINNHIVSQQSKAAIMSLARQVPRFAARISARPVSTSAVRMAAGDAGAPRSGGAAQGDAFTKREQASEDYYVRQQEAQKLEALKKKIADGEAQLAKDRKELEGHEKK
ncbi:hypothetical protein AMS68_004431 [Peltaster fructicola]|uniref:ATPase inhibitor, mitochondrial n=1 Tax=Peltaster fructicola TaxID=286661 RepID=A0A6H0XW15_9PEZI|nr:hypothetical protein AMS68_004431 [Peltaster fructicola]